MPKGNMNQKKQHTILKFTVDENLCEIRKICI